MAWKRPLPGHHDGFDGQRLAAHFGPGETGDDTDLVFAFHLAVAVLPHAGIGPEIGRVDLDLLRLVGDDLLDRLARQIGELALEIPDAGLARVVADQIAQRARR